MQYKIIAVDSYSMPICSGEPERIDCKAVLVEDGEGLLRCYRGIGEPQDVARHGDRLYREAQVRCHFPLGDLSKLNPA